MVAALQVVFHLISSITWEVATVILILIWSHDLSKMADLWNGPNKIQPTVIWLEMQAFPGHTTTKACLQISSVLLKVGEVEHSTYTFFSGPWCSENGVNEGKKLNNPTDRWPRAERRQSPLYKGLWFFFFYLNLLFGQNFKVASIRIMQKKLLSTLDADSSFVSILFHLQNGSGIHVFNVILAKDSVSLAALLFLIRSVLPPISLTRPFPPMFSASALHYCPGFPALTHRRCMAGSGMGQQESRSLVYHLLLL